MGFYRFSLALLLAFVWSTHAHAGSLWNYLKQYQVGIDYSSSSNIVAVEYETASPADIPRNCGVDVPNPARMRCGVEMQARGSSGFGIIVQQAFKRQGLFYLNADVGIGARYLQGRLPGDQAGGDTLPLQSMDFRLAAAIFKPYLQFGITPKKTWPDVLIAFGPAFMVADGDVSVNGNSRHVTLGSTSGLNSGLVTGFTEVEVVLARFGDGLFSVFANGDYTNGDASTAFYPGEVDNMSDFRADFYRNIGKETFGIGLKLLLAWP